jgi:hypothetical protein
MLETTVSADEIHSNSVKYLDNEKEENKNFSQYPLSFSSPGQRISFKKSNQFTLLMIHGVNTIKCESSYISRHFDFRSSFSKYKMKLNVL